jgi:serine/threonine protein kinase
MERELLPPPPDDAIFIEVYLPACVSQVIGQGSSSFIGLIDDKTVLKYPCVKDQEWERFVLEERIYKALCPHPRIITCYGLNESGLKLEYAANGTLLGHLHAPDSSGSITTADRVRWAHQAAEAVAYIHTKRVIHCDINVRNILLDEEFNAKRCDFQGEYVDEHGSHHNGYALENTKAFLPRSDDHSDEKSDLFALGTAIYEIMTNHEPFPELEAHKDAEEIERRYQEGVFLSVDGILGGDIIRKCWTLAYENVDICVEELKVLMISL